jgi:hypothetical protein
MALFDRRKSSQKTAMAKERVSEEASITLSVIG